MRLEIREEVCFESDVWVPVGEVTLHPADMLSQPGVSDRTVLVQALRYGFFDWRLPDRSELEKGLLDALKPRNANPRTDPGKRLIREVTKVRRTRRSAVRAGTPDA